MIIPCDLAMNQQAVCQTANGQPTETFTQVGSLLPEGNVVGLVVGLHQYWRTGTAKMYIFNGTVGTSTGWVILN